MTESVPPIREYRHDGFVISTDKARLDLTAIHAFLKTAYWCESIPLAVVVKSSERSPCFGMCDGPDQIGFTRVISDQATFAYLGDVSILKAYRGKGLFKWPMRCVMEHPALRGLRRFSLATRDAHGLYAKFGFRPLSLPDYFMEIFNPEIYRTAAS